MSQFYAEIQGNRGGASRMGSKDSGITGHIRGWHIGARVSCDHEDGFDVVEITGTKGSAGYGQSYPIATIQETPNGQTITLHKPNGKPSVTYKVPRR